MSKTTAQKYPRLPDSNLLDASQLVQHTRKIPTPKINKIIAKSIDTAARKTSRAIVNLPEEADDTTVKQIYENEGWELFKYFHKYSGDPAYTAYKCLNRKCTDVATEQFHNRALQKERMNSAWTYQYIARDTAIESGRFKSISDLGLTEADFNAVIKYKKLPLYLAVYVSVKNRSNTMGGQDWPKAIAALEKEAVLDKNRDCEYICVFGITMERGDRTIRAQQKTGVAYSSNTEIWFSDFFWPFFSNYSYEEISQFVLSVLLEIGNREQSNEVHIPTEIIRSFQNICRSYGLISTKGVFNNASKLVEFFCRKIGKRNVV